MNTGPRGTIRDPETEIAAGQTDPRRYQQAKRIVFSAGPRAALIGFLVLSTPIQPQAGETGAFGGEALKNATILIIRHAEKPATGPELTPTGNQRAAAYAQYFHEFARWTPSPCGQIV